MIQFNCLQDSCLYSGAITIETLTINPASYDHFCGYHGPMNIIRGKASIGCPCEAAGGFRPLLPQWRFWSIGIPRPGIARNSNALAPSMHSNPPDRLKPPCQKFTDVLEYLSGKARNMVMAICAVHQCCFYPSKPVVPTCEAPRVFRRSIQENSCDTTNQRLQNHALQNQFVTLWALSSCQSDMRFPMWVPGISLLA